MSAPAREARWLATLSCLAASVGLSVRLRSSRAPRFLTVLRRASGVTMQAADSERTPKRPRYDGSPRTQPNTPSAVAERSPSPELDPDCKTWGPEEVCVFLKHNGFSDSGVLDRFRGSKGWGAEGLRDGDPRRGLQA